MRDWHHQNHKDITYSNFNSQHLCLLHDYWKVCSPILCTFCQPQQMVTVWYIPGNILAQHSMNTPNFLTQSWTEWTGLKEIRIWCVAKVKKRKSRVQTSACSCSRVKHLHFNQLETLTLKEDMFLHSVCLILIADYWWLFERSRWQQNQNHQKKDMCRLYIILGKCKSWSLPTSFCVKHLLHGYTTISGTNTGLCDHFAKTTHI